MKRAELTSGEYIKFAFFSTGWGIGILDWFFEEEKLSSNTVALLYKLLSHISALKTLQHKATRHSVYDHSLEVNH